MPQRIAKLSSTNTLFRGIPAAQYVISRNQSTQPDDREASLRNDIKNLGQLLGASIKAHDPEVFASVEKLRALGREWRAPDGRISALEDMVCEIKSYENKKLLDVSRSFANFLALANSAENHHRIRRLKDSLLESESELGLWPKKDSCAGSIKQLIAEEKVSPQDLLEALRTQKVEIVLTAHPTEVNRRTMLKLHNRIKDILQKSDRQNLSKFEQKKLNQELAAQVASIWDSDDLRRKKPSPVDEAKVGLAIVENVLWNAIPNFLRKLDDVAKVELGAPLGLDCAPIKMASWMGGDRDGNPNVTPEITLEVVMLSRWSAATAFLSDVRKLRSELSLRTCSDELRETTQNAREPYRELLKRMETRLSATVDWTMFELGLGAPLSGGAIPIKQSHELMEPLLLMHRSLVASGHEHIADGALVDTIRRVAVFGMSLMALDLRQESTRHTEALDAITGFLGLGSYSSWDEVKRREWLQAELASKRPLLPRKCDFAAMGFSPNVVDTLETFKLAAKLDENSLGAYVISQCQQASDILAVMLLQQDAGVQPALRVVPLFETLDDLQRSAATVESLFGMKDYLNRIDYKQEIMVGYSDSAKDAGRLAASWAQYNAQVAMMKVANKYGTPSKEVEITFFHGKGGTVGRGGNPAVFEAIKAHPPGTVNGRFRVTEQGEMITQNFGQEAMAERTLDLFTAGVLSEKFQQTPVVKPEWEACMERLSEVSCDAYRGVVRGEERFVPYFRSATPEQELAGLNVGSRPAKRNPKGGVESLRAIPWVFAWTQTRLNLPTWLGVGEALAKENLANPVLVQDMYSNWPWFRTLIDLLEMILVKSDLKIAENYDVQLVTDPASLALGRELRGRLEETEKAVLAVSGHSNLQVGNAVLLRSLAVRNPYVDPLNVIQAELLRRLRRVEAGTLIVSPEEKALMQDALLITINGVANGMRNSG
jgi:phosphoenolpyruvate carboxylase